MTGNSLDRSVLLDLGSVREDKAEAEEVEVTKSDVEVMCLPWALTLDVLLFLSFFQCFLLSLFFFFSSLPLSFFSFLPHSLAFNFFCLPFLLFLF